MLYAYRLTKEEYLTLAASLRASLNAAAFERMVQLSSHFCAQFVLFSAEWWHREYQGGPWRWTPIFQALGYRAEVSANARTDCVERGFAFWGQRPEGAGKRFFGAIVAHGGLPLKALGQGVGRLTGILHGALRMASRYGWHEQQLTEAVRERASDLPESLQRDAIYSLLAQIVLTALELRREYSLTASADVLAKLQRHDPRWMERFPISLEESAAMPLLTDLVREAASQQPTSTVSVFTVDRTLLEESDRTYRLKTTLRAKRTLSAEELARSFRLHEEALPRSFSIDISQDASEPWLQGRLLLGQESAARLDGADRILTGAQAFDEICLLLRHRATTICDGPLPVPGGAALSIEQPWVFADRDSAWRLVAQGGARLPDPSLRVAVPPSATPLVVQEDGSVELVGCLHIENSDVPELKVFTITGSVRFPFGDQVFAIRCGQSTRLSETYSWEGKRLPWQPARLTAFRGKPALYCITENGTRQRVPATEVMWRAPVSGRLLEAHAVHGIVDAYVVQADEMQARFRMLVLDESATVDFKSGSSYNQGCIQLKGFGAVQGAILDQPIDTRIEQSTDQMALHVRANATPPESVRVNLAWRGIEAAFTLPFPSTGGRFFDSLGRPMNDRVRLDLQALLGSRLRIFDQNPSAPKSYAIELELQSSDRGVAGTLIDEVPLPLPENGVAEIRLIDFQRNIETLLGFSSELDACVKMSLKAGGRAVHVLHIARYAVGLEFADDNLIRISPNDLGSIDKEELAAIHIKAAPLIQPAPAAVELEQERSEGVPTGAWDLGVLDPSKRHWLIFPDREASVAVRPAIWLQPGCTFADGACSLSRAMAHPDRNERLSAIGIALDEMCEDYGHESWSFLEYLCGVFLHLPLGTLDVLRMIAARPNHAVALAMRITHADIGSIARRLGSELGFVWELTSPYDWFEAARKLKDHYRRQLSEENAHAVFPILIRDRLDKLREALPSIGLLLDLTSHWAGNEPSEVLKDLSTQGSALATETCRSMWKGEQSLLQTNLLRCHIDDTQWPEQWFFRTASEAFSECVPDRCESAVKTHMRNLFWVSGDNGYRLSVINVPILCALWAATGNSRQWWEEEANRLSLRKIRAFDPEWFRLAYQSGLVACLGFGLGDSWPPKNAARNEIKSRVPQA